MMSRTVIDIDDALLAAAAIMLGTTTKRETVNTALRLVAAQQARLDEIAMLRDGTLADTAELDSVRDRGWRR